MPPPGPPGGHGPPPQDDPGDNGDNGDDDGEGGDDDAPDGASGKRNQDEFPPAYVRLWSIQAMRFFKMMANDGERKQADTLYSLQCSVNATEMKAAIPTLASIVNPSATGGSVNRGRRGNFDFFTKAEAVETADDDPHSLFFSTWNIHESVNR